MTVTFTAVGLDRIKDTLDGWEKRVSSNAKLSEVDKIVLKSTMDNYEKKHDFREWPARTIMVGTAEEIARGWPILNKTGAKRAAELQSILQKWEKTNTGYVKNITSTRYGIVHQEGLTVMLFGRPVKIPVRKSVWLQDHVIKNIERVLYTIFGAKK